MAEIISLTNSSDKMDTPTKLNLAFAEEMTAVEKLMQSHIASYAQMIPDIGAHIVKAGGKRIRPMLTLAAAKLCGYQGEKHIQLSAAVEYMHTATLLHDDVVDDSDLRRGQPTARLLWSNAASVLVGDFMLGQAFRMMVTAGSMQALDILSKAAAIIAEGEVLQLENIGNVETTQDAYLRIIEAKTAVLFAAAAEAGSVIADATPTQQEGLESYGRNLGVAFQLLDDALDYGGLAQNMSKNTGKNMGDDFREGKVTLPMLLAYRRGNEEERQFWHDMITTPDDNPARLEQAISYMRKHNTLFDTIEHARHYGGRAKDALAIFPDSDTKQLLLELVDFCIERTH